MISSKSNKDFDKEGSSSKPPFKKKVARQRRLVRHTTKTAKTGLLDDTVEIKLRDDVA